MVTVRRNLRPELAKPQGSVPKQTNEAGGAQETEKDGGFKPKQVMARTETATGNRVPSLVTPPSTQHTPLPGVNPEAQASNVVDWTASPTAAGTRTTEIAQRAMNWLSDIAKERSPLDSPKYYAYFENLSSGQRLELLQDWYSHPVDRQLTQNSFNWVQETVASLTSMGLERLEPLLADPVIFQNFSSFYSFLESNKTEVSKADLVSVRSAFYSTLPKVKLYRGMVLSPEQASRIGTKDNPGVGILAPYLNRVSLNQKDEAGVQHRDFVSRWFVPKSEYDPKLKEWAAPLGPITEAASRVSGGFGGLITSFTMHPEIAESVGYWASGVIDMGTPQQFGTYLPQEENKALYIFEVEAPLSHNSLTGPYWARAERKKPSTLTLYKRHADGGVDLQKFDSLGEHRSSYEVFVPFGIPSSQIVSVKKQEVQSAEQLPRRFVWE
jgi:hypothetical protein